MFHKLMLVLCGSMLCYGLQAQTSSIADVLQVVEQNNKALQSMKAYMESKQLKLRSGNNLPDPEFGAYFLPFGGHSTGEYSEFQLSQTFEFPTVYGARNSLIDQKKIEMKLEFESKRQKVLSTAQKYCQELIFLNKREAIEQKRVAQAKTVFDQIQELFQKEEIGILESNKAKVVWMQEQFKIQKIRTIKRNLLLSLKNLNGGKALVFEQAVYLTTLELDAKDILWQSKLANDPFLKQLKHQEVIAAKQLKLSKSKSLPNITAGYNSQGVSGERFSGVYGGVTIPLWSNKNKLKSAQSNLVYQMSYSDSRTTEEYALFEQRVNDYQALLTKYQDYQNTLLGLHSDELLLKAYQLEEISFMEYYSELQFYRQAFDDMLQMEAQLYQLKTDLLEHQL